ncbi:MAG: hypothetical protein ACKVQS_09995, partial [Fimbriimonadaceae bacterium]
CQGQLPDPKTESTQSASPVFFALLVSLGSSPFALNIKFKANRCQTQHLYQHLALKESKNSGYNETDGSKEATCRAIGLSLC